MQPGNEYTGLAKAVSFPDMQERPLRDPRNRSLLLVGFAAFILLGAQQALYGPSFPLFRDRFGLGADEVSAVVSAQFLGAFISIAVSSLLIPLLGYRRVLVAGAAGVALGLAGVALGQSWWQVLAGAFVGGLGFGLLNVTLNVAMALAFRPRSAPALNLLNAVFGIGAVAGPLLVAAFAPDHAWPFLVLAAFALFLLVLVVGLPAPDLEARSAERAPIAWGLVGGFVLIYFLYVSFEGGIAAWTSEYLTPDFGAATAAGFTSIFWGALTVGRFLAIPLSAVVRPGKMVLVSMALALLFMLLAHDAAAAPYYLAAAGLFLAPFFGTGLAWLAETFPDRAEQVTPVVVAAANLGPVVTAPLIGVTVAAYGPGFVPTALSIIGGLLVLTVASLFWRTRGPG